MRKATLINLKIGRTKHKLPVQHDLVVNNIANGNTEPGTSNNKKIV